MTRPPANPPHLSLATISLVALIALASPPEAAADELRLVTYTASELRVLAHTPDTHVRLVDLTTNGTLTQFDLRQSGDIHRVGLLPDVVSVVSSAPVQVVAGTLPSLRSTGGWSGFVSDAEGRFSSDHFVTWADGDLLITVPLTGATALADVAIEIVDLSDGDDSRLLTAQDALASHRRFVTFLVTDLDDDQIEILSSHQAVVQIVSAFDGRTGWITAPASAEPGEDALGVLSGALLAVQSSMTIIPLHDDTEVEIVDWTDGDDSHTLRLSRGQIFSTVQPPGQLLDGLSVVLSNSPIDRDLIEIRASRPVAVLTGAFEALPRRGALVQSHPIAPGRHAAWTVAEPGLMHLLSLSAPDLSVEALVSVDTLGRPTQLAPRNWRGAGPYRAAIEIAAEQIVRIEASAPFIAISQGSEPAACCGPYILPPMTNATLHPPVAEAGPRRRTCSRQPFSLDGSASFDPDLDGAGIVQWQWDLDLGRNTDSLGGNDDDADADTPVADHLFVTSGIYRARLTVTDNEGQSDIDEVEIQVLGPADPFCGGDPDTDGIGSTFDNCPEAHNPDQLDLDNNGLGDACDPDIDGDAHPNDADNCPRRPNDDQGDNDGDGQGDACDEDWDNDGVLNTADNCPWAFNRDQRDRDGDGVGDTCDRDIDGDGHPNSRDNCPNIHNPPQSDTDGDDLGDLCDTDDDDDGVTDPLDNCQTVPNPDQADLNNNDLGDACEQDRDLDAVPDHVDNCPDDPNPDQLNTDNDAVGDACDRDRDGDFFDNERDNCPLVFNPRQEDTDNNGVGDICEPDADGDGISDARDNCPSVPNPAQIDLDRDELGNACDDDLDGDGLTQAQERLAGTRVDNPDTDLDGLPDGPEIEEGSDPILWDTDGDHLSDGEERRFGTNPLEVDTDTDGISDGAEPGWNEDSDYDGLVNAADPDSDNGSLPDGAEIGLGRNMLDPTDDVLPTPASPQGSTTCATTPSHPATSPSPLLVLILSLTAALRLRRRPRLAPGATDEGTPLRGSRQRECLRSALSQATRDAMG